MALNLWTKLAVPGGKSLVNYQQIWVRQGHTWVLERLHRAPLAKPNRKSSLRQKHYVYKALEGAVPPRQEMLSVVLKKYVEDVGKAGEIVPVKERFARLLIMTNQAAYTSPENIKRYAQEALLQQTYSSKFVKTTINALQKLVITVFMNKENAWTVEPWHIRAAFRREGVIVPQSAIIMPDHVISGPDMEKEGKEFYVRVTINGQETATVRARIYHWATNPADRAPLPYWYWKFPADPIFAEDKEIAKTLPEIIPPVIDEDKKEEDMKRILKSMKKGNSYILT